ncbi:MAG: pyridoxamine 5'-phosphate oxidase family protein [Acidimicrobiales bacterium]
MLTWGAFREARPDLAQAGQDLLYQFGVGLGFLGTVRPDGGPRLHPMCPIIHGTGLYALLVPSPKARDLRRDPRYALHTFPPADNEDAIYLTGEVIVRDSDADIPLRTSIDEQFLAERSMAVRSPGFDDQTLVELLIDSCLLTRTTAHGDHDPQHTVWRGSHDDPSARR